MGEYEAQREGFNYLLSLGIKEDKAKELTANKRVRSILVKAIEKTGSPKDLSKEKKKLLHKVIELSHSPEAAGVYIDLINQTKISTEADIKNAESIIKNNGILSLEEIEKKMEENIPSLEEIDAVVSEVMEENIEADRTRIIRELKHHPRLQFIDHRKIFETMAKIEIDKEREKSSEESRNREGQGLTEADIKDLLEMAVLPQAPTRKINRIYQRLVIPADLHRSRDRKWTRYLEGEMQTMHTPFTNYQKRPEILKEHIKRTKGQVRVRFPPEPNGHLHIGHAKAMSINFGYRDFYKGWISLRYDDTNPKAEKTEFYEKIEEMVKWMGFTPDAITHASDYFDRLYDCAVELIRRGKAYVCHLSREEASEKRKETMSSRHAHTTQHNSTLDNTQHITQDNTQHNSTQDNTQHNSTQNSAQHNITLDSTQHKIESPWRDRSVEENLNEFQKMKDGGYEEGEAVLRMKMDMTSDNPQLWDLVAYRVIKHPHVRTGSKWVVYPSYDFTHCLTDSFEDITHSFCTTEFINSRESYNWLCDALDLYRPVQWEYSRLNITGALLSKRFITKAIEEKAFTGWDDPRLSTLEGLRSRGVPPHSIRRFVESLGITTAASEIPQVLLDNIIREDLSNSSKSVAVLRPLEMNIAQKKVLIDRTDLREGDPSVHFYRIQKGTTVFLKDIGKVKLAESSNRELVESDEPHNAVIPWLETDAPEAVLEIVCNGETVEYKGARVSKEAAKSPVHMYWQFIRIGFFIRIPDKETVRFRMVAPLKSSPVLECITSTE